MNINLTIIVQAVNFFVVYLMLRSFLFKPAVTIIEQENAEKNSLINIILQQQKSLEIQQKEKAHLWFLCQEYFISHKPPMHVDLPPISDIMQEKHLPEILPVPEDTFAKTLTDVQKTIVEKIKHVH